MKLLTFGAYFLIGTLATLFPSVMPEIIRGFGLRLGSAGLIFPAGAIGSVIGGLGAGIGSDRHGRKPFIAGAALLSGLSLYVLAGARQWPLFVGAYLILGLAQGALSNSINALVLDLNAERRSAALNALHGTFSLGAMVSPYLVRALLGPGVAWRPVVLAASAVWLSFGVAAIVTRGLRHVRSASAARGPRWVLLRSPHFALVFAIGFLYNGVSWSLLGWIKVALQSAGQSPALVTAAISLFYVGLTTGRFACARWSEQWTYGRTLVLCAAGASIAYPLVVFAGSPAWIAVGIVSTGLFQSGLYPTGLAYATRRFPELAGTVTGTMAIAMTAGASLPPWWTGLVGGATSLSVALRLNGLMLAPLAACCVVIMVSERQSRRRRGSG